MCQEINWLCLKNVIQGGRVGEDAEKKPEIDAEIEFDDIEGNSRSVDTDGGVKVLSEKMGYDENYSNDRMGPESIPTRPFFLFAKTADPFSSHYPFLI